VICYLFADISHTSSRALLIPVGYNYNTMTPPSSSYPPPPTTLRSFSTPTSSHEHPRHSQQGGCACGASNCTGDDLSSSTSSYRRSQSTDRPTSAAACATTPHTSLLSVRPPDSRSNSLGRWSVASSSAASHDELFRSSSVMADSADDVFSASAPTSALNALSSLAKLKDVSALLSYELAV
jgi:hypothetical protein